MNILKYKKKKNGQYELMLESGEELSLYEDVILNFDLLLKKAINDKDRDKILKMNQEYDVYYVALKSLKSRFRSVKDLKELLLKKQYPEEYVNLAIDKLLKQGYLDDCSFAKAYINQQMITTSKGPLKIERELLDKGVSFDIIYRELAVFTKEEQLVKIEKIATRLIKSNRSRGGMVLRKKITYDLQNLGYDVSVINEGLANVEFSDTKDIQKREYEKLYRRLSKKYSGRELEFKIREKLYQKGLYYED